MTEIAFEVGVVIGCRRTRSVWAPVAWRPVAALAAAPPLEPGAFIAHAGEEDLYFAGGFTVSLHSSETAHYRDNLRSGRPSLWVAMSLDTDFPMVRTVTADPYEGEAMAEIFGEGLDAVPMPATLQESLSRFIAQHHVERTFQKRTRT